LRGNGADYLNPKGSGHTATVRPEGVAGDIPKPGGTGPLMNDVGRNVGVYNYNWAFRSSMDVHFYTPVKQ